MRHKNIKGENVLWIIAQGTSERGAYTNFRRNRIVLDKAPNKGKLDSREIRCTFFGYNNSSKGYGPD